MASVASRAQPYPKGGTLLPSRKKWARAGQEQSAVVKGVSEIGRVTTTTSPNSSPAALRIVANLVTVLSGMSLWFRRRVFATALG